MSDKEEREGTKESKDCPGRANGRLREEVEAHQVSAKAGEKVECNEPLFPKPALHARTDAVGAQAVHQEVSQGSVEEHRRQQPIKLALSNSPIHLGTHHRQLIPDETLQHKRKQSQNKFNTSAIPETHNKKYRCAKELTFSE